MEHACACVVLLNGRGVIPVPSVRSRLVVARGLQIIASYFCAFDIIDTRQTPCLSAVPRRPCPPCPSQPQQVAVWSACIFEGREAVNSVAPHRTQGRRVLRKRACSPWMRLPHSSAGAKNTLGGHHILGTFDRDPLPKDSQCIQLALPTNLSLACTLKQPILLL